MDIEIYDAARDAIEQTGFTPIVQTKISMLLTAAKNVNALFLGAVEFRPFVGLEQQFLHTQYFQEMESVLLLAKVTRWVSDPRVYREAMQYTSPIWKEWQDITGPFCLGHLNPHGFYQGLALGHAMLSQIRVTPIVPSNVDEADPYVMALRRIEQDNARMLQTQIMLLRCAASDMAAEQRETIIEEKQEAVRKTFVNFLNWLANGHSETPAK